MKFIDDITNFIFLDDKPQNADIIFIPGGSYPEIAEKAVTLWSEGYSPIILPSGRYSVTCGYFPGPMSKANVYSKKYHTEWEFLKDVLIQNGVDESYILREDEATNTYENAIFSKRITDKHNLKIQKAIVCCKAFHARRCLMYYQTIYQQTQFIVCPTETKGINKENWFKTDEGINKVLGELSRCGSQFVDIIKTLKHDKNQ
jgi:uncharacterized SAM-binding protein YcdF (DUF218 family)